METIYLLPQPRRAWLTSFGLVASLATFVVIVGISTSMKLPYLMAAGAILALCLALCAKWRPNIWVIPYRAWNKLARHYAEFARRYLLLIMYYGIFSVVKLPGTSFGHPPQTSGSCWVPRGTLQTSMYGSLYHSDQEQTVDRGRIRSYASWAMQSGQPWAIVLLPFLALISALEIRDENTNGSNLSTTYTLF